MILGILICFIMKIKSNKNMNMDEMEQNITFYGREEYSVIPKTLTKEEIKIAKYNTVIKLNNIILPSTESNFLYNETYLDSFYKFSYNFFVDLNYTNFSPLTLYNILINIYMAISDKEQLDILNNILKLNNDERIIFYSQIFKNNNFNNSEGEIKISNGAFYNSDNVEENKTYINQITKTYTECYKLSYENDFNFITEWINKSIKEKNFMKKDSFKNEEGINLLLFSSLYYQQKWATKYVDSETYKSLFYIDNINNKEVDFMKHSYYLDYYYDYDNYISFCDFYSNYYSIQYIIPKSLNDSILELVKNKNFLLDNDTNKINNRTFITLSVPKFKIKNEIDFIPLLEKLGLEKIFNKDYSNLNNPFIIKKGYNYYLNEVIQKNIIELNEDGTIIKSISAARIIEYDIYIDLGFEIKLNQPFIYIIRDRNKLPIFIGYIKEPNYD